MKKLISAFAWITKVLFEDEEKPVTIKQGTIMFTLIVAYFVSSVMAVYMNTVFHYSSMTWHYVNMSIMLLAGFYFIGMSCANHVKTKSRR